tara:strand:+ start:1134 stop:1694 length:561 start_codon:yes stop_codon:yes gene_type:complete
MSYKLYTDKKEIFECKLFLEGASFSDSSARIVVESDDISFLFPGEIDKKGNCKVPIKKFKGLMGENDKGTMKLEVIADGTYIEPWNSDFIVETSTKVKVEVKSQSDKKVIKTVSTKPQAVVSEVKNEFDPVNKMVSVLTENGITLKTVVKNKQKIAPILQNYSKKVGYVGGIRKFIKEVVQKLSSK